MRTSTIKSTIWNDPKFQEFSHYEGKFFMYLLSCESHNTLGIYEISLTTIAKETNFTKDEIISFLEKLAELRMAWHYQNYMIVANKVKYNSESPSIVQNFSKIIKDVPRNILEFAVKTKRLNDTPSRISEVISSIYKVGTGCMQGVPTIPPLNLTQSNLTKSNQSNPKLNAKTSDDDDWTESFRLIFKDIEDEYGLSNSNKNKLRSIAGTIPGQQMITDIFGSIERSDTIKKKGNYMMKCIVENSIKKV